MKEQAKKLIYDFKPPVSEGMSQVIINTLAHYSAIVHVKLLLRKEFNVNDSLLFDYLVENDLETILS